MVAALLLVLALAGPACSRPEDRPTERGRAMEPTAARTPVRPAAAVGEASRVALRPGQVVAAIGDVHGDLTALRGALKLAGVLDDADRWCGGDRIVVITGDYLDRGDDEQEILALLPELQSQATAAGGALHALLGNHELLNAQGKLDYVSERGKTLSDAQGRTRRQLFAPGGPLALRLATGHVALIVGRTVFVHGGVSLAHARRGLDDLNRAARAWLTGERAALDNDVLGLVWLRDYSLGVPAPATCDALAAALLQLGADRMVMGHSVQETINAACDGRAWRIDVGLSRHYGSRGPEVLLIEGDRVSVKRAPEKR